MITRKAQLCCEWDLPETFCCCPVSVEYMTRDGALRQVLAILRGIALIVAIFWALILLQLAPSLVMGGVSGVRDHIYRVAVAGVPAERRSVAVTRMYEGLAAITLLACLLFLAQHHLARMLRSHNDPRDGVNTQGTMGGVRPSLRASRGSGL